MSETVQRRGQGRALTLEQTAQQQARSRVAQELQPTGRLVVAIDILWSPEETVALRAMLAGKGVAAA